jgi:hypothetical protein
MKINNSKIDIKKRFFSVYLKRRKLVLNLNNTSLIISQVRKFQKVQFSKSQNTIVSRKKENGPNS